MNHLRQAVLVTFFKFGDHISYFQRSAEDLQREYNLHQSSRKHYTTLLRGAALDLFMDRIDELRQEQHKLSLELEKTVRDQEQKIGELTKAIRIKSMPTQEQ